MKADHYFYNCSKQYIDAIDSDLYKQVIEILTLLPKRQTQAETNHDLFWLFTVKGWSYDTTNGVASCSPLELSLGNRVLSEIKKVNDRELCKTSTTINAAWHSDFAKSYARGLVQVEAQFGKVESMFKDFCGFRIAHHERRLALGIEIVMSQPTKYFAHRKSAVSGMAYFDVAKSTLPSVGLDCPIWLIGIRE
jgi:hypothetical protein